MPPLLIFPYFLCQSCYCIARTVSTYMCNCVSLQITGNIGMVYSGMGPDYRLLIRRARKMAQVVQCSCTLKSELLRSFAQCRTTTLCIMRRSPRRSWCTEWRSSCRSTPSLAGYPSSSCHHLDFILYHLSSISSMIISR